MRIFCPATLPHSPGRDPVSCRALIALIGLADQAARPVVAPLFTCLGPPAPAVGCVTLTQPGPRPKLVTLQIGTGRARVGAGRMPGQAQTWPKATRTVCPRSRCRPNL